MAHPVRKARAAPLDTAARRRHKLRNTIQSAILLVGMVALLAACLALLFGPEGALWGIVGWAVALAVSPSVSPRMVLSLYQARRLFPDEFPAGFRILETLARRAGLAQTPVLYYAPTSMVSAFTMGNRDDAAIVLTDGMLRTLNMRELAGVLAHELSHVRNNDLWVMSLADSISRLTGLMAVAGLLLACVTLPLLLVGVVTVPIGLVLLLVAAPTIGSLMQLALSRAREFDADLDAAGLTGDPAGLASALEKLERFSAGFWERMAMPGRRVPEPSLLRTHPQTWERVRRLMSLYGGDAPPLGEEAPVRLPGAISAVSRPPRWRASGLWY
jgi:heat shock protein HtpX